MITNRMNEKYIWEVAPLEKSILDIMLLQYETFTAAEKKIVDYVLAHQKESQYISITELSAACNVAISTVSVFCRKLKLAGFNDFKIELARASTMASPARTFLGTDTELRPDDSIGDVMNKVMRRSQEVLHRTAHLLDEQAVDRAAQLMTKAGKVLFLGQGNHAAVSDVAWTQFSLMSPKFETITDSHLQVIALSTLTKDDVAFYFSYTGATNEIMDAVEIIRDVGARMILLTRFMQSPAAEYADVILRCGVEEKPLQYGSVDALISQMYIIEVLSARYAQINQESSEKYREFIGKALAKRHM